MNKLINLGKPLSRAEQKSIYGGSCSAQAVMCLASCSCSSELSTCVSGYDRATCICEDETTVQFC